jgi:hypothetical protein
VAELLPRSRSVMMVGIRHPLWRSASISDSAITRGDAPDPGQSPLHRVGAGACDRPTADWPTRGESLQGVKRAGVFRKWPSYARARRAPRLTGRLSTSARSHAHIRLTRPFAVPHIPPGLFPWTIPPVDGMGHSSMSAGEASCRASGSSLECVDSFRPPVCLGELIVIQFMRGDLSSRDVPLTIDMSSHDGTPVPGSLQKLPHHVIALYPPFSALEKEGLQFQGACPEALRVGRSARPILERHNPANVQTRLTAKSVLADFRDRKSIRIGVPPDTGVESGPPRLETLPPRPWSAPIRRSRTVPRLCLLGAGRSSWVRSSLNAYA